jgi:uncharacterized protein (DUF58 family)
MTIFILAVAVIVIGAVQYFTLKNSLENVEEDYGTSAICVEPGEQLDLILRFRNRSRMFIPYLRYQMTLPEGFSLVDPKAGGRISRGRNTVWHTGGVAASTVWLAPRQQLERHIPITAPGRGRYSLHELTVYGGDFLGMKESCRGTFQFREVVVYPREAKLDRLKDTFGGFLGDLSVQRFLFEDPVLTLGCRDYTGREPMKTISWTQSAKRGSLMVNNYDHTAEPSVSVILNADGGKDVTRRESEYCFELARAVCAQLEKKSVKYDFSMNAAMAGSRQVDCAVPEGLGQRHFHGVLECLGRATDHVRRNAETLVQGRLQVTSAHGFIIITPERDENAQRAIRMASRSGAAVLVLCAKELEGAVC